LSFQKSYPKKQLGQHFLVDTHYSQRIADAVTRVDGEGVLEIGPGEGSLSKVLVRRFADLHMIEIDEDVIPRLVKRLGEGTWTLHKGSALNIDFSCAGSRIHVVGNLPYNRAALIIKKSLLLSDAVASCTFMVQREVAERIVSKPHSKTYGWLSVFCQYFGDPRILFHVPPGAFFPPPNVFSSVFQLRLDATRYMRLPKEHWTAFFLFVEHAFQKRRKMLVNAFENDKQMVNEKLEQIGISSKARPEDLSIDDWVNAYKKLCM
jgi:16S rRNA (adenine1518-N6/adenine1519-N6)-dimethyltransferase